MRDGVGERKADWKGPSHRITAYHVLECRGGGREMEVRERERGAEEAEARGRRHDEGGGKGVGERKVDDVARRERAGIIKGLEGDAEQV